VTTSNRNDNQALTHAPSPPPDIASLDDAQRQRRAGIVDAAISMLLTTEYERIQMRDLTVAAGVALGTTYRYFASKDHLMAEALHVWASRFPSDRSDRSGRSTNGRSVNQLKRAFRTAVRAFEPHPNAYDALTVLQRSTDPYAVKLFDQFATNQMAAFELYLPRLAPERRRNVVRVMNAVVHTHLRAWSVGREPIEDVYAMVDITAELLLGD
jgi:TetR/AcrR family transcriptional regulator, cholesterol catabolism regulator